MTTTVRNLFHLIDTFNISYNIDAECDNYLFRIYSSWNLYALYSSNVRNQIIEKMLLNNFSKIYINIYFKNEKGIHSKRNNMMTLELNLYTDLNNVFITSGKSIIKFNNSNISKKVEEFFKINEILFETKTIEDDIKKINKLNFRKAIRIHKLEGNCFYSRSKKSVYNSSSNNINLIIDKYDKKINFELELGYMLFNQYFIKKTIEFDFDNYSKTISEIEQNIIDINCTINTKFKNEKKIFSIFKNQDYMFMETVSVINSCEEVFDLLSNFKNLNYENKNKELIFEKFQFLESLITIYNKHEKNSRKYNDLISELEKNPNVKLVLTNKHATKHKEYYGDKNRHLQFNFSNFKINIRISKYNNLQFEKIKHSNLFFNLLEPIFNHNFVDYIEKFALSN